ncbi:Altered inheritance of mitochondria protein 9 [Lasiodiplodia hormozganensis]|uniref:Altered inheritance of mitochondria protein 9 n=1 Tax=Lasiodiplodia hormozganensis TaxID=869390 RepID=A0AA40CK81_9PEZI|nr:Altered inheritance of mitochondria protein 9 [Lasiodiplodia hormozganensis]
MASLQDKDASGSKTALHVDGLDAASTDAAATTDAGSTSDTTSTSDASTDNSSESGDDEVPIYDEVHIPSGDDLTNLPFRVTRTGPPKLSSELQRKTILWRWYPFYYHSAEWRIDPEDNVELIKETIRPYMRLCGLPSEGLEVKFLTEGAWNQVYTISASVNGVVKECIFRLALPDFPWYRTQIEVSTTEFIRHHTSIPVPRIYAFNSSMKSPLGLEWILMEKVQGRTYAEAAWSLSFDTRAAIHRKVADWADELSRLEFDQIGSLYHDWSKPLSDKSSYLVGPLNDDEFKSDLRLDHDVHRGPFASMQQYTSARIAFRMADALDPRMAARAAYREAKAQADEQEQLGYDSGFRVDAEMEAVSDELYTRAVLAAVPRYCLALQSILPTVFASERDVGAPGFARLAHIDIHGDNVMVGDDAGDLVALLDWEQTMTLPLAWTPAYPKFVHCGEECCPPNPPSPVDVVGPRERGPASLVAHWEQYLLRCEFERRLEELDSPLLGEKADTEDVDTIENHFKMMHKACLDDDSDEDEVFVLGVKARARRAFAKSVGAS